MSVRVHDALSRTPFAEGLPMVHTRHSVTPSCPELLQLLQGIVDNPDDNTRYLILADWLEEDDDPRPAELLRLHRQLLATCCQPDEHPERAGQQTRLVELLAEGVSPCVPRRTIELKKGVDMQFVWIPPGAFLMGSPASEEGRGRNEIQQRVSLPQGFYLGVYPATQEQWQAVMRSNPSEVNGDSRPVDMVSWDDCAEFCKQLGAKSGKHLRLPREAEWEYACRAGTTTPFHFGTTISAQQANYNGNEIHDWSKSGVYRGQTTPVGSFPPNAWGLYDMHGNVWEWCSNSVSERALAESPTVDFSPERRSRRKALRGGSWQNASPWCRSAAFVSTARRTRSHNFGCRVVLSLD
jgi:uncharacterized protein (TIGR02996 family)